MSYNTSTGVYSPAPGATTASAGQTIASATWNSIHSDLATALTTLGEGVIPILSSVGSAKVSDYISGPVICNFAASGGSDIGTFPISLPSGATGFRFMDMRIYNAAGNLNSAVVSLFTAASAGGVPIVGSTATTVTSSTANSANSAQVMVGASASLWNYSAGNLYLHVTSSTATSTTASVIIRFTPSF